MNGRLFIVVRGEVGDDHSPQCEREATHVDAGGWVYCASHAAGYHRLNGGEVMRSLDQAGAA